MSHSTDAEQIQVLTGLEAVRRRPTMYLGDLEAHDLPNRLLQELMCCTRDAATVGNCSSLDIYLSSGGRALLRDDGPSLPLARHSNGKRLAEVYLTVLGACHRAKQRDVADSTCGVGIAVVNAVCRRLTLRVHSDGTEWRQEYSEGRPLSELVPFGPSDGRGTELSIELDSSLLPTVEFVFDALADWISCQVSKLQVRLVDRRDNRELHFPPRPRHL